MHSPERCIVCSTDPKLETRNGLQMKVCPSCKLFWRAEFDLDIIYYEEKDIILDPKKLEARRRNVRDRADMAEGYVQLDNVCDIGCGEGLFLQELVKRGAAHVIGMEPGAEAAEYARSLGLTVVLDSIENLAQVANEHGPISVYTLFHVIEHLPDPIAAIRLMRGLLPEGGALVLETPDFDSVSFTKRGYRHKHIYPEHLFYWNPRALELLLKKEGFEVVANTHRDFDRFRLEPREALRRLGILMYPKPAPDAKPVVRGTEPAARVTANPVKEGVKRFTSYVLSLLVIALGRGEYLWLIAKVPSKT